MKHTHTNINIIDFKRTSSLLVASISVQQNQSQQNGVRAAFKIPFIYLFIYFLFYLNYIELLKIWTISQFMCVIHQEGPC